MTRSSIVIIRNYPARAASSSRVNSLNTNPRRSLAEAFSHLMKSGNFIATPNSASTQSARISPVAATVGRLSLALSRLLFLHLVGPFEAARRSIPLLVHPFKKPCSGVSDPFHVLSHLLLSFGYANNVAQERKHEVQRNQAFGAESYE